MPHYTILVSGKVQGVFYRASTVEKAIELGLKGFAQNLPDGRVLIEAEGHQESLQKLFEWCKKGPSRAVVTNVEVKEGELKNHKSFIVKHQT
jgi:acylphosphatase